MVKKGDERLLRSQNPRPMTRVAKPKVARKYPWKGHTRYRLDPDVDYSIIESTGYIKPITQKPTLLKVGPKSFRIVDDIAATGKLAVSRIEPGKNFLVKVFSMSSKPIYKSANSRVPITDFAAEAKRIGVPLGPVADRNAAMNIVKTIAKTAYDLFPNNSKARRELLERPLDEKGRSAIDLVQLRGAPSVLLKLEQMRYGFNG